MKTAFFKTKRIYVAGAITGIAKNNIDAFRSAEEYLQSICHETKIVVPHDVVDEYGDKSEWHHGDYMRATSKEMVTCDLAVFIPGWKESVGAKMEYEVCTILGIPTKEITDPDLPEFVSEMYSKINYQTLI